MLAKRVSQDWLCLAGVFLLVGFIYSMIGPNGKLHHDDAVFFYGGQAMVRGTPVYVGVFDHKGPLGQMICGLGVWVAKLVGRNDLATTRLLFLGIASATATGVFALSRRLFGSKIQALVATACFVSFVGFGAHAFSGTRPKMLVTMFEVFTLILLARRSWFWTGVMGALAAFTWQPTGVLVLVALFLATQEEDKGRQRFRAIRRVALGALAPTLALFAYAALSGSLGEFIDGCFVFNVSFLENSGSLRRQFKSFMQILIYNGMGVPTLFGLLGVVGLYAWRIREVGLRKLARDPFACILFTFPFPVAWSLLDFQQYPDFFVFLPYVALALGWLVTAATRGFADMLALEDRKRTAFFVLPAIVLFAFSSAAYRVGRDNGLLAQRAQAAEFRKTYGDATIAVIGVPEVPVLLARPNIVRYPFIMRGIRHYIDARERRGFSGWLRSISAAEPDVLIVDEMYPDRLEEFADAWTSWLSEYDRAESIGDWSVFIQR